MKAVHVFFDIDMRQGHNGLFELAKKKGVDLGALKSGDAVLFFNVALNKAKAYCKNGVVMYARFDDGLSLGALNDFVEAVDPAADMQFTREIRSKLIKLFGFETVEGQAA